jgi:hypothetical protein
MASPYKIGNDATEFRGIENWRLEHGRQVRDDDVGIDDGTTRDGVLQDQAFLSQYIKGLDLDGGSWAGTPQTHDGDEGCKLGLPLSSFIFGGSTSVLANGRFAKATVYPSVIAASPYKTRVLARWPVFVPDGCDVVGVVLRFEGDTICTLTLRVLNASFAELYSNSYPERYSVDNRALVFNTAVSQGAVNIFSLEANCDGVGSADGRVVTLQQLDVLPMYWQKAGGQIPPSAQDNPSNSVASKLVVSSSFLPVWSTLVNSGEPLPSIVAGHAAKNNAYLHELITGQALPGKAALTATPHDHDGSNSQTIDSPLHSSCFGWPDINDSDGLASAQGECFNAPTMDGSTSGSAYYAAKLVAVQLPTRSGSPSCNFAVSIYDSSGVGGDVRISTSTDLSSWSAGSAVAFSGAGWSLAQSSKAYASGSIIFVLVEIQTATKITAPAVVAVTGLAVWDT